jgi:hypothetical protein
MVPSLRLYALIVDEISEDRISNTDPYPEPDPDPDPDPDREPDPEPGREPDPEPGPSTPGCFPLDVCLFVIIIINNCLK